MSQENQKTCPTCMGNKIIPGVCESSQEWTGSNNEDDMQCTPDEQCPTCNGNGYVTED